MRQAKQRGTFDERKATAKPKPRKINAAERRAIAQVAINASLVELGRKIMQKQRGFIELDTQYLILFLMFVGVIGWLVINLLIYIFSHVGISFNWH